MSTTALPDPAPSGRERSACVVCEEQAGALLLRGAAPSGNSLEVLRCARCGHVYLDGWSATFEAKLYDYYTPRVGDAREEAYDPLNAKRHLELLSWLETQVPGRRLLDVGCGEGQLVASASEVGWDALGIDLATGAIQVAQSFGVRCKKQDFFGEELDNERFDAIVMSELIEHVPAPVRFFRRARELLVPGGLLYLTTPNFDSVARRIMRGSWHVIHPEHVSYFTPDVLCRLALRDAGLSLVLAETKNFDPRAAIHLLEACAKLLPRKKRSRTAAARARAVATEASTKSMPRNVASVQRVRTLLEGNAALRATKRAVNAALSAMSGGDTIYLAVRRTPN